MMLVSIDDDDDDAGDDIILWKKLDQLLRPIPGALFQSLDSEFGPDGAPDHNHVNGLTANSHHDKNPPWWEFVSNEYGGNMPVTKSHH